MVIRNFSPGILQDPLGEVMASMGRLGITERGVLITDGNLPRILSGAIGHQNVHA